MSEGTAIEWTHRPGTKPATWNPIRGVTGRHWCTKISPGCVNCYAETLNVRFGGKPYTHGKDSLRVDYDVLKQPRKWRDPHTVFVCSMTDLFHESLTMKQILDVFTVMQDTPKHTYMVLTKRIERALEFCKTYGLWGDGEDWPVNVWLGVSVENQEYADKRIPPLLDSPALVKFVSYEPALGLVDFNTFMGVGARAFCQQDGVNWLIIGGESGTGRREMNLSWAASAIMDCKANGVACFVKQDNAFKPGQRGRFTDEEWALKQFPNVTVGSNRRSPRDE